MSLSDFPIQWRLGVHLAYQIESSHLLSLSLSFQQQSLSGETMDPTLVLGTWFESQFHICVYEHAILRIYISFFSITLIYGVPSVGFRRAKA